MACAERWRNGEPWHLISEIVEAFGLILCVTMASRYACAQVVIPPLGTISTIAGTGGAGYGGDGGAATSAILSAPDGIAVDGSGNIYIADQNNFRIRKIAAASGIITTIAGSGVSGYSGDGGAATSATMTTPVGIAIDGSGNLYFADTLSDCIRKVPLSTGVITTVAGICDNDGYAGMGGYSGDGGQATSAKLFLPMSVAVDAAGNLYIADSSNLVVRKVTVSTGIITTFAGSCTIINNGFCGSVGAYSGDGGAATSAKMNYPTSVAVDGSGNVYIADSGNHRVRKVTGGVITTFAGNGAAGYSGDGGAASGAELSKPWSVVVDSSGNVYVTDAVNQRVRKITVSTGNIATVAGNGVAGYSGDGGAATSAAINNPEGVKVDPSGNIYIADTNNNAIRIVGTAPLYKAATITVNGSELPGDAGTITISFNGFTETITYGPYSTTQSIASAFAAKFSNDYLKSGLCAYASGTTITFKLKGASYGALDIVGSTASFQLVDSGFPSQVTQTVDSGTVTLTVNGVVAAAANYGDGATTTTVAQGLAAGVTSGSPVNVTWSGGNSLLLQSKQTGTAADYNYTLQTTRWDSADFPNPSFAYPPVTGALSGGTNAGSGNPQTIYSYSIPSYVSSSTPTGYDANGNIVGYTDSVMGTWSMSGGYDQFNRLTSASATSGTYAGLQASWGYDPFGNRTSETFSGTAQMPVPTNSTAAYNNSAHYNWISSTSLGTVGYDASGDVTQDNQNQYLLDGDGRVCAVKNLMFGTMIGYVYGADGTRVSTGTIQNMNTCDPSPVSQGGNGFQATKDSILGPTGGQLTETNVNGTNVAWAHTNVWANGALIGTYDSNGLHFYLNDWTGSRRVQTDYEGVVEQTCTNLPYGDGESCSATPTEELYAGLESDSESGLDNAMYRSYAPAFGRWTTPDPYPGSYNLYNPQSMNRYAYVGGSPFGAVDPSGLDPASGWFANGVVTDSDLGISWFSKLAPAIPFLDAADMVYQVAGLFDDLGQSFGWWGGGSKFHGNAAASQSGKRVPGMASAAANAPLPDPDDERIRQLAVGINNEAGWIGTPQGVAGFYGASLVGAAGVVAAPAAGAAINEGLLGPAAGRLFWSGYSQGALEMAESSGVGQTIGQTLAGRAISATVGNSGPVADFFWGIASRYWASGASGGVTAYILNQGQVWTNIELPELFANPNVNMRMVTWPSSINLIP